MGVRGLTIFLETMANCAEKIDNLATQTTPRTGLAIDGNSLIYYLIAKYELAASILQNGGIYFKFERCTEEWLQKLQIGCKMEIFMFVDGLNEVQKTETHQERNASRANKACSLMQALEANTQPQQTDFLARVNIGLYVATLAYVCKKLNIHFYQCTGEADLEIAKKTIRDNLFACLSNDSDFFCMQACYIPLASLKISAQGVVSACLFTPAAVLCALGFSDATKLAHFANLVGNDYITQSDKIMLHDMLHIPSANKNVFETIKLVVKFINSFSNDFVYHIEQTLSQIPVLRQKYTAGLLQYNSHSNMEEAKMSSSIPLFELCLKFRFFKSHLFQTTFPSYPFGFAKQTLCYQKPIEPQFRVAVSFASLRQRLYDLALGADVSVEEVISADLTDNIKLCYLTKRLPTEMTSNTPFQSFLWVIGKRSLDISTIYYTYGPTLTFRICCLHVVLQCEILTQDEQYAMLLHLFPTGNPLGICVAEGAITSVCPPVTPRIVHLVSLYEYCTCLCADANYVCGNPFGDMYLRPASIIDGVRLTNELQGQSIPELDENMLKLLPVIVPQCTFKNECRFTKCSFTHPDDVWGLCKFDGKCTDIECDMRHQLQTHAIEMPICRFDGRCARFSSCKFKHVKQK